MSYRIVSDRRLSRGLVLLAGAALALPAMAEVRRVPQQYATIQAAINAAVPGDTVVVGNGVWSGSGNYNLNLLGKAITLRSVRGPANCTIDASGSLSEARCGIMFVQNETSATVIDGFTISGGDQFNGGGIYIESGSPTIRNCVITGNRADCWGAGVYSNSSATPTIINCLITGNTSAAEGGGFFSIGSDARVENCVISNNVANSGGGVCVFGGFVEFVNCQITNNFATSYGGGGYMYEGRLTNCTIAGNRTGFEASGVYTWDSVTTITNTIIWGNTGSGTQFTGSPIMTYSIVEGGATGQGNLSSDPRFVNAPAGNFRIMSGSSAIDAGNNNAVPPGVVRDLAGLPRFLDDLRTTDTGVGPAPVVDIGAFELALPHLGSR